MDEYVNRDNWTDDLFKAYWVMAFNNEYLRRLKARAGTGTHLAEHMKDIETRATEATKHFEILKGGYV